MAEQSNVKVVKSISDADGEPKHFVVSATKDAAAVLQEQLGPNARVELDLPVYLFQQRTCVVPSAQTTCPIPGSATLPALPLTCTSSRKWGKRFVPYGVDLIQALDSSFLKLTGNTAVSGVTTCIIDTGVDRNHPDLLRNKLQGCEPPACAFSWYGAGQIRLQHHGTHVAGILAATGSPGGLVGAISQGTNLYIVNMGGDTFKSSTVIEGMNACLRHLWAVQVTDPMHKMVVSMSFGAPELPVALADTIANASQAGDVLFVGAAGNSGVNTTNFPAAYPEVISVGSVDCSLKRANSSATNADLELVAPGVGINSTFPQGRLSVTGVVITSTSGSCDNTLTFSSTKLVQGSAPSVVDAGLVDCGLGLRKCAKAKGKVCVIDRGNTTYCLKANNCRAGGGVGVIFINNGIPDDCAVMPASTLNTFNNSCTTSTGCNCVFDSRRPFPAVGLSAREGRQLRQLMAASLKQLTARVMANYSMSHARLSGTSMAAPYVSGVAAKLWNKFRTCSASAIRSALTATAMPLGAPGRDLEYGFGMIRAAEAAKYLKTYPCSSIRATKG